MSNYNIFSSLSSCTVSSNVVNFNACNIDLQFKAIGQFSVEYKEYVAYHKLTTKRRNDTISLSSMDLHVLTP